MSSIALKPWIAAARPKTLTASLIPIVVGTSLAYALQEKIQLSLSLLALLSTIFIQLGTNLINDAADFDKGADTEERLGPVRLIQAGVMSSRGVWWAGVICFSISVFLGIPLVIAGGWPIIAIGLFSVLAGYAYTAGPFPLAYLGLGDLFVLIFFGWVAVGGIYYLNTGSFDLHAWIAGSQVGLLATVLIAINNFRDSNTDRKANKKTLSVRLGPSFSRFEIGVLSLVPFGMGMFWFQQNLMWASFLPLLVFPLAVRLVRKVYSTEPGKIYNDFLAQSALLQLSFGMLLGLGLILR